MTAKHRLYKSLITLHVLSFFFISSTGLAAREVLFEGYHKILSGKQHVGYTISRFELDSDTKRFHATIFVKLGALAGNMMESFKGVSDQNMSPISYDYTTLVTENGKASSKSIQANFKLVKLTKKEQAAMQKKLPKGEKASTEILKMTSTINENGKITKILEDLPKGTFLSYFLVYLMLKSKSGIQTDSKYEYRAIAEEKSKLLDGVAIVHKEEEYKGIKAFKIENKFSDQKFISYVTDQGHVIGVVNPSQSIETELVAKPAEAIGDFAASASILKNLFGDVPLGVDNIASKKLRAEALKSTEPAGSKQYGAPAGSGIQTKPTVPTVEKIEKPIPVDKAKDK